MKKRRSRAARAAVTQALDLPGDILLDEPRFVLEGNHTLRCENHKGIVEYREELLRLRIFGGEARVSGRDLTLEECANVLRVGGWIESIALFLEKTEREGRR